MATTPRRVPGLKMSAPGNGSTTSPQSSASWGAAMGTSCAIWWMRSAERCFQM